jgi:hypothetical protein
MPDKSINASGKNPSEALEIRAIRISGGIDGS